MNDAKKRCSRCNKIKFVYEFHKAACGYRSDCKVCRREANKESQRKWKAKPGNLEKYVEYQKEYQQKYKGY